MRKSLFFALVVSFAMFGFGFSLKCYSCPDGVSNDCEVTENCGQEEDTCLKLISGGNTYTACQRYADCDFSILAARYVVPAFTFKCCQSDLCNAPEKSFAQKFKEFFG